MYKFGAILAGHNVPFSYPNVWAIEHTTGPDRLIIAPSTDHVGLLRDFTDPTMTYCVLYVLLLSRSGRQPGRYQCAQPVSHSDLELFFHLYGSFFESDGRHHLWVMSEPESWTMVYDQHNVIYAYGPPERYRSVLDRRGLRQVSEVRFPSPHTHHYHVENDDLERQVMEHWEWKWFPLAPDDDW